MSGLGRRGEDIAAVFLRGKGLEIIGRNVRTGHGELDLVALDRGEVVFVEVKTRSSQAFGGPRAAITPAKIRRLSTAALAFLQERGWLDRPARFDFLGIVMERATPVFDHLKNAFDLEAPAP